MMKLIQNARIYTFDSWQPEASAMLVDHERVVAVGDLPRQWLDRVDEKIDLAGKVVLPGLTDAHIHLEHYALSLRKVDCETGTRQACLQRVAERVQSVPAGEWVLGHGWNQNSWSEGFGRAADLDAIAPANPVYLTAKSLHAAWANSLALLRAHISAGTPDPEGGRIGRNPDGSPNGILYESAMELVADVIPAESIEQVAQAIHSALPVLWHFGLTGVHDFDRRRCFAALQKLRAEHDLKMRVVKSIPWDELSHAAALGLQSGFGDDLLSIGSVKGFADGALGPQTAAMLQPYENDPTNWGMLMLDREEIYEQGRLAVESGLSLAIHAIGDKANHEVLDAFYQLRAYERQLGQAGNGDRSLLRHRIEHVQVIHPDDAARLAQLEVIASMQPIHAPSDKQMADRYWGERAALAYAWRTQLNHGAKLAFGSDAPVESPNPFWGIYAALTRRLPGENSSSPDWYPEQRLTVMEAFQAYTQGAAYAAGKENRLGKLLPGYFADLIVLDHDPFQASPEQIRDLLPVATMLGGEWVFYEL
jgi:predicted amidohydrolase YtcJ